MEKDNLNNIEEQSSITPPIKAITVNGKKKLAINGVVNLDLNGSGGGVQADWNQNDENAPDFIKNRICYEAETEVIYLENANINSYGNIDYYFNPPQDMLSGTYTVSIGEETVTLTMTGDSSSTQGTFSLSQGSGNVIWNTNGIPTAPNGEKAVISGGGNPALYANAAVKIYNTSTELVTINDKFIPDTVARTSDIPSQIQSNWTQTGSSNLDFIKNKPSIKSGTGRNSIIESDTSRNVASGEYSHTEGSENTASLDCAHSEGYGTKASGYYSHSEGCCTIASGGSAHAEGSDTIAAGNSQHVFGECNIENAFSLNDYPNWESSKEYKFGDMVQYYSTPFVCKTSHTSGTSFNSSYWKQTNRAKYVEIVGNGLLDGDISTTRSNARTLDWSGNENIAGMLRIGSAESTGGCLFKVDNGSLKISFDNGTTWLTVSAS